MGNTSYTPRAKQPWEKPAKSPRSDLAPLLVASLITVVQQHAFRASPRDPARERECYLVAREVRDLRTRLNMVIHEKIPGSDAPRTHADYTTRMDIVDKIVMVFTDHVVNVIVRPGPTPEDRQACDLVTELAAIAPELEALVAAVIVEEDRHEGLLT